MYSRTLRVNALDDFSMDVPARDAWNFGPILARQQNGDLMSVRDKGPLWLVYPRDQNPELQTVEMDARWVWQIFEIVIL